MDLLTALAAAIEPHSDNGSARLCLVIVNKHTDERTELPAMFDVPELEFQTREALRRVAQVEALVTLGREIVNREEP